MRPPAWTGLPKYSSFFKITLPMVSPTLFVVLIMRLMASLKVYDLIYMMVDQTNPALTSAQSLMYLFVPGILCGREPGICFGHRDLDRGINRHYYGPAVLGTEKMG